MCGNDGKSGRGAKISRGMVVSTPTVNPGSAPDECEDFDNLHLAFRLPQSCIRNVVFFEEKSLLEAHCSLSCSSERKREIHDYEQN